MSDTPRPTQRMPVRLHTPQTRFRDRSSSSPDFRYFDYRLYSTAGIPQHTTKPHGGRGDTAENPSNKNIDIFLLIITRIDVRCAQLVGD